MTFEVVGGDSKSWSPLWTKVTGGVLLEEEAKVRPLLLLWLKSSTTSHLSIFKANSSFVTFGVECFKCVAITRMLPFLTFMSKKWQTKIYIHIENIYKYIYISIKWGINVILYMCSFGMYIVLLKSTKVSFDMLFFFGIWRYLLYLTLYGKYESADLLWENGWINCWDDDFCMKLY